MGEFSFLYKTKHKPAQVQAFKYKSFAAIEYAFGYIRKNAISGAEIFDNPIPISKVVKGLSLLYSKRIPMTNTEYYEYMPVNSIEFQKLQKYAWITYRMTYDKVFHNSMYRYICSAKSSSYGDKSMLNDITEAFKVKSDGLNWIENIYITTDDKVLNVIHNLSTSVDNFKFNIYRQNVASPRDKNSVNIYYSFNLDRRKIPSLNKIKNIKGYKLKPRADIKEILNIKTERKEIEIYKNFKVSKTLLKAHINDFVSGGKGTSTLYIYTSYSGSKGLPGVSLYYNLYGVKDKNILNSFKVINSSMKEKFFLNRIKTESFKVKSKDMSKIKISSGNKNVSAKMSIMDGKLYVKNKIELSSNNFIRHANKEEASNKIYNITIGVKYNKELYRNTYGINVEKYGKNLFKASQDNYATEYGKSISINIKNNFIYKNNKEVQDLKEIQADSKEKTGISHLSGINSDKENKTSDKYLQEHIDKNRKNLWTENTGNNISKLNKDTSGNNVPVFMLKNNKKIYLTNNINTSKKEKSVKNISSGANVTRIKYKNRYIEHSNGGYKKHYDIVLYKDDRHALRKNYRMSIKKKEYFLIKAKHGIRDKIKDEMLGKKEKDMSLYKIPRNIFKDYINSIEYSAEHILKEYGKVSDIMRYDNGDYIVPVAKTRIKSFIDYIDNIAFRKYKETFLSENVTASVISKKTGLNNFDIRCDKASKEIRLQNKDITAIRNSLKIFMKKQEWIFKENKKVGIKNNTWIKKIYKKAYVHRDIYINKINQKGYVQDFNIFAGISLKETGINNNEFINKSNKFAYYYYNVWSEKTSKLASLNNNESVSKEKRNGFAEKFYNGIFKENIANFYETVIIADRDKRTGQIYEKNINPTTDRKELYLIPETFVNWAWVYEPPNPFDTKTFGIDELLLPENDIRYEDFENIIFDKENMVPREPVKILSNTSFIAKYPTRIPISKYADIGKIYEVSAEKWENYFGVETQVMKDVFLKYYQIWQGQIFEFSTMTMVESVSKMLDYLYEWIMMHYPVEKQEQALRVFRQIRWYSESAIIQNSQYIISYEYDILRSELMTGKCKIPCDIQEDPESNPTMYIDKANGIIRNNRVFDGSDAWVTFRIELQKNSSFKFDLHTDFGKGSVKLYINDELKEIYVASKLGNVVQLPYTGETIYLKIIKEGVSNIGDFYIGNIIIPDASFKNLKIDYDPQLRAGNKPVEEVARKMIQYASLAENRNEMYEVLKRTNLGPTETIKKMNEYWKLHHKDKTKGKRLTIKQV